MRFGSVCSGIEAASVAWHPLGWKAAWLSEIEPFPSAVLAHHYPDVPNLGDMTTLPERILSGEVEAPDLFCGGTPCQAFSVAGLRNSLDDARGNLSLTFVGIANAIDHVRSVRSDAPAIIFWENVPGVLSTKDNAFGCFLGALAGEDEPIIPSGEKWTNAGCVYGPQRAVAWRVLDAQYFGVAQRRRRVFVVASARADFDPAAVLFEFDGLRRDIAPSRETGQAIAPCVTNGPLFSRTGNERVEAEAMVAQPYDVGNCLTARMHKGINTTLDEGQTPVISIHPHCIGRAPEAGPQGEEYLLDGSAYCMDSRGQPQAISIQDVRPVEKAQNGKGWNDDGTAYTVDTHATQGVAQPMVLMDQGGSVMNVEHDMVGTLRRETHGYEPAVLQAMQVRRLTPVECERLQGFPDGYTNIPWRKKPEAPDGPRYKALGNSWAVPVVAWIGKRIQENLK
jgi:DNA (cytosine-5)-methyltransferase 1